MCLTTGNFTENNPVLCHNILLKFQASFILPEARWARAARKFGMET